MDMYGVGNIEKINNWKNTHSIDDLKKIAIDKGYSGFAVSNGEPSFHEAYFKKYGFKLKKKHLAPIHDGEPMKFYLH